MRYDSPVPHYHVENFGCRATQSDGAAIERQFEERGLTRASTPAQADLLVINSCTVTAAADSDARAAIRRFQRQNPAAKIVVTGCYAQRAPQEVAALPGVACVIGNSHKHQLAELALANPVDAEPRDREAHDLGRADKTSKRPAPFPAERVAFVPLATLSAPGQRPTTNDQRPIYVSDIFAHTELQAAPLFDTAGDSHENQRTRPNLKVQDGCDNRCSFCVIPYVRGQSRSLPLHQVLAEVNALVAAGYREVVISGINLGRWGRDLPGFRLQASGFRTPEAAFLKPEARSPKPGFEELLRAILSETRLEKLRISSVEPMDWTDDLITLVAHSPRIAKHAHVPLQSGSDAVLRRMHRKYRPWHYREKIEKIRAAMPTAAIGADVMVGFPGETEAEFESTRRLIADLPFTYLHVFTYSPRPGTPAADMPNQVPGHVARERNQILRDLASEKKQAFLRTFIGKKVKAITLGNSSSSCHSEPLPAGPTRGESERGISGSVFTESLTDNYQKLYLRGRHAPNRWVTAHIVGVEEGSLVGSREV